MVMTIHSAKNMRYNRAGIPIPIVQAPLKALCPARWLCYLVTRFPKSALDPLFSSAKWSYLSYSMFQKVFKQFCARAGIVGNFASHSLRRGGASTLAELGVPLIDIKN